ncbi:DNA-binding protein [Chromobacterium vaccinii]|uniref:DNA-binding protein n=1 Tax=Chromobacterium vaccinii TaxID=1108595 RepID=UPI003C77E848
MAADIYARIRQAAFELVGEGVWPTVVEVRARLGSGSNTTINNTLKAWRQEFLARVALSSRRPDWPPSLVEAFEQVWQKACDESERQLESVRQEMEAEAAGLRAESEALTAAGQRAEAEAQSLRHQLELGAARQVELDAALRRERLQLEALQREREALSAAAEALRGELAEARQASDARQAELEQRHEQALREARAESERKEALAYERLEGLRVRLYQQVEDERRDMKGQLQKQETVLQQTRQDAAKVEGLWRERMLERERDNGGLLARLELSQQQADAAREELERQRGAGEAAAARVLEQAAELARLQERQRLQREHWLERIEGALAANAAPAEAEARRSWLEALLEPRA